MPSRGDRGREDNLTLAPLQFLQLRGEMHGIHHLCLSRQRQDTQQQGCKRLLHHGLLYFFNFNTRSPLAKVHKNGGIVRHLSFFINSAELWHSLLKFQSLDIT
jgi:hypothetical protein